MGAPWVLLAAALCWPAGHDPPFMSNIRQSFSILLDGRAVNFFLHENQTVDEAVHEFVLDHGLPEKDTSIRAMLKVHIQQKIPQIQRYASWIKNYTTSTQGSKRYWQDSAAIRYASPQKVYFHQTDPVVRTLIKGVLAGHGFTETSGDDWTFLYSLHSLYNSSDLLLRYPNWEGLREWAQNSKMHDNGRNLHIGTWESISLKKWQVHNHCVLSGFPGLVAGNKANLHFQLEFMKNKFGPQHVTFYPQTYKLPEQYKELSSRLLEDKQMRDQSGEDGAMGTAGLWVVKKTVEDNGYTVKVVSSTAQLTENDKIDTVVQQYVPPLLLRDRKFHLRLYVVITCHDPLTVHLYRNGLVLLAPKPFAYLNNSTSSSSHSASQRRHDLHVHITNGGPRSAQLRDDNYRLYVSEMGWSLDEFWEWYRVQRREGRRMSKPSASDSGRSSDPDQQTLWRNIEDLVVTTILSMQISNPNFFSNFARMHREGSGSCYDLFGFDVMWDQHFRPYVLEVNYGPDMAYLDLEPNHQRVTAELMRNIVRYKLTSAGSGQQGVYSRQFNNVLRAFAKQHAAVWQLSEADMPCLWELYRLLDTDGRLDIILPAHSSRNYSRYFMKEAGQGQDALAETFVTFLKDTSVTS